MVDFRSLAKRVGRAIVFLVSLALVFAAADVALAKVGKAKAKRMEAAAAMPSKPGMDIPPLDDDFLHMANDPVAKPLSIVDAFSVDGPITAEKVAALKLAAEKKSQSKPPAARKPTS